LHISKTNKRFDPKEEDVGTVADTVAVSFLDLPEELVQGLLLAPLAGSPAVDVPPACRGRKTRMKSGEARYQRPSGGFMMSESSGQQVQRLHHFNTLLYWTHCHQLLLS